MGKVYDQIYKAEIYKRAVDGGEANFHRYFTEITLSLSFSTTLDGIKSRMK